MAVSWVIARKLPGRPQTFWLDGAGWVYMPSEATRFGTKENAEATAVGLQLNSRATLFTVWIDKHNPTAIIST